MSTQEKNDKQAKPEEAKPVKRVLTVAMLRHLPGIAVRTNVKAGWGMKLAPWQLP